MTTERDRLWAGHEASPASRWIYMEDLENGRLAGAVEWRLYEQNPFEASPWTALPHLPRGERREFGEHIVNQIGLARKQWCRKPHAGVS